MARPTGSTEKYGPKRAGQQAFKGPDAYTWQRIAKSLVGGADALLPSAWRSKPSTPWLNAVGAALSSVTALMLFLWPEPPLYVKVAVVFVAISSVSYVYVSCFAAKLAWLVVMVALLGSVLGIALARIPTEAEPVVAQYFDDTYTANIWVQQPHMYDASQDVMVEEFGAFDPRAWHGQGELDADPRSISHLIQLSVMNNGALVETAGMVVGSQHFGNFEAVYQLDPIDSTIAAQVARSAVESGLLSSSAATEVIGQGIEDAEHSYMQVRCRATPRPFFSARPGDVLVVRGAPVAYGPVMRQDGHLNHVVYLACSNVERLNY